MDSVINTTASAEVLTTVVDAHFAGLMLTLAGRPSPVLERYAREVSKSTRERNLCIDTMPDDRVALAESGVVGTPEDSAKPMIMDAKGRLYLNRYWQYERTTARRILALAGARTESGGHESVVQRLAEYFPEGGAFAHGDQRQAAEFALGHRLSIISGGPGTGKTTTVAVILALLIEFASKENLLIALAAPTGKAAARLQESIVSQKQRLRIPASVKEKIPEQAVTIHRLLRRKPGTPYFVHDSAHPLIADVLVLDECSMIDAALMAKLLNAVGPSTQLIMLGDKDQLSSVEAGAVFNDLCSAGLPCVKQLVHSYRFGASSGIGALSRAVNDGDVVRAFACFAGEYGDIAWRSHPDAGAYSAALDARIVDGYRAYLEAPTIGEAFRRLRAFAILCAVREGPYGVVGVNERAESVLRRSGLIEPGTAHWYKGRPVMITENDYGLSLFNGDVGIVWPEEENAGGADLVVCFENGGNGVRSYHPSSLPAHETVFAMTVHKSQGSQFTRVLTILPSEESPVVTRELVYTAITRAESYAEVWSPDSVLRRAIETRTVRHSGLCELLEGSRNLEGV